MTWLRRHWLALTAVVVVVLVAAACVWFGHGALTDANERRAQRNKIESLALDIKAQSDNILQINASIAAATSPAAQQRQALILAGAIAELQRSIDCVGHYMLGQRPPACAEVDKRMDELLAGLDPFSPPKGP